LTDPAVRLHFSGINKPPLFATVTQNLSQISYAVLTHLTQINTSTFGGMKYLNYIIKQNLSSITVLGLRLAVLAVTGGQSVGKSL